MISFIKKVSDRLLENSFWRAIKPWLTILLVYLVLRYTGMLTGLSTFASGAMLHSGVMDASDERTTLNTTFTYNFNLTDLNGNTVPASSFKGKTIFLNVWATWCGPCRVEMPSIQKLYEKTDSSKVAFIMLAVDDPGDDRKVIHYMESKKFTFPVYRPSGELPELLMVPTIPTTFVISPEGKVVSKKAGMANYNTNKFLNLLHSQ